MWKSGPDGRGTLTGSLGQKTLYGWKLTAGTCCPRKCAPHGRSYKNWGWLSIWQLNIHVFNFLDAFFNFVFTTKSFIPTSTHICYSAWMGLFLRDAKGGCLTPPGAGTSRRKQVTQALGQGLSRKWGVCLTCPRYLLFLCLYWGDSQICLYSGLSGLWWTSWGLPCDAQRLRGNRYKLQLGNWMEVESLLSSPCLCLTSSLHWIESNPPFLTQLKPCLFWWQLGSPLAPTACVFLKLCLPSSLGGEFFAGKAFLV